VARVARRAARAHAGRRVSASAPAHPAVAAIEPLLAARLAAAERFLPPAAPALARLCHRMAERFARNGRLLALASEPAARSDARHVAVEFVHPVIVGKRALPALALTGEAADLLARARALAGPDDIAIAFGTERDGGAAASALAAARERGALTVCFAHAGAEWELPIAEPDARIAQELAETAYHLLWELVHVFFEHHGLLEGRPPRPAHDAGAASFLYPFLADAERDLDAVLDDVRRSVLLKAQETSELRARTLREGAAALGGAADAVRAALERGGSVLALGFGGSATDAMDLAADLAPARVLDLTEDAAVLTAIANDVGPAAIFSRQVIAHGRPGDALVAFTTSGASEGVLGALAQARRQGLATIALAGSDGGRIAAEGLADHVIVSPSPHIPRIQEAQASALHVLCELVRTPPR
jgi:D-sedoheptulose 7-phosphate isomerase